MPAFGAKILNNAVSSLNAQQTVIANIGNNIANANTEGYTRRRVELETRSSQSSAGQVSIGSGVNVANILRISDSYLEKLLRETTADQEDLTVQNEFLDRVESVFSLVGESDTVGSSLTKFFSSLSNLKTDPANVERRREVIERGKDLVTAINVASTQIASLQKEADARLETEINTVNGLTTEIANLNQTVAAEESSGRTAADARDTRDRLFKGSIGTDLFSLTENNQGEVNITLANGFALVVGGSARALQTTTTPSFYTTPVPPSLSGETLSSVVYDYSGGAGTAHLNLTQTLAAGSGSIAGLIKMRGYHTSTTQTSPYEATGELVDMASRIESIAMNLLTQFNTTYRGPNIAGGDLAGDITGLAPPANQPGVFGFFTFAGAADGNADGAAGINDLTALRASNPSGFASFARLISLTNEDPRTIAAALDADPAAGTPVYAPGDGRNLDRMLSLQNTSMTFAVGSYSYNGTFEDVYNDSVSHLGNLKNRAKTGLSTAEAANLSASNRRDSNSAVNLDEEFANLIKFQKAFQASARMVRVADELLEQLVSLI